MSKVPGDNLDWARELGCPPSACADHVKKILNRGIINYVWDEISSTINPVEDVIETRKNILLHYLRNQEQVPSIQHIHNKKRLKAERALLLLQIKELQNECEKRDEALQQKGLKLAKIKHARKSAEIKKNVLELKYQETSTEMSHIKEMLSVCQNLLPPLRGGVDENIMKQSLAMVGAISCRQDKHQAWRQISANLGTIAISDLWSWLLKKRIEDTEKLINLGHQLENSDKSDEKPSHRFAIAVAKVCGQHIISTASKLVHLKKSDEERERAMNYLQKLVLCDTCETTQDWIALVLEVAKLKKSQTIMQSEIDQIKKKVVEEEDNLNQRRLQLASDIHDIDSHMEQCLQKIKNDLRELESAPQFLLQIKNQMTITLDAIASLHSRTDNEWLEKDLSSEMEIFHESLDINALDQVMLRGRIGAHRHASTCISNALISTFAVSSASPVYRAPLYHLIYCFRDIIMNSLLKERKRNSEIPGRIEITSKDTFPISMKDNDIMELLDATNSINENCRREIENFNSIFDAWMYQPVQEAMAIIETPVHGATFTEWIKRYTTLAYMIQRRK